MADIHKAGLLHLKDGRVLLCRNDGHATTKFLGSAEAQCSPGQNGGTIYRLVPYLYDPCQNTNSDLFDPLCTTLVKV